MLKYTPTNTTGCRLPATLPLVTSCEGRKFFARRRIRLGTRGLQFRSTIKVDICLKMLCLNCSPCCNHLADPIYRVLHNSKLHQPFLRSAHVDLTGKVGKERNTARLYEYIIYMCVYLSPTKIAENLQGPCPIFGPACEPCNTSSMGFLLG